jgi:hydrogenase nickel incorporation protein HypA/HybF
MHELSIAMSIVELAEEESERRGGLRVRAVHLRLGLLAGVVKDALLSSYEMACGGVASEIVAGKELEVVSLEVEP